MSHPAQSCGPTVSQDRCLGDFPDNRCYLCTSQQSGQLQDLDDWCEPGCLECRDHPSEILQHRVQDDGRRFLKPHGTPPNRDAQGYLRDLKSMGPGNVNALRVPYVINYERAPCHDNDAIECFYVGDEREDKGICSCMPGPRLATAIPGQPSRCNDGVLIDAEHVAMLPECGSWTGSTQDVRMDCRHVNEHENLVVQLGSDGLLNASVHRTTPGSCFANMLIACHGRAVGSRCGGAWANFTGLPPGSRVPPTYYNETGTGVFNRFRVRSNTAAIRAQPGEPSAVRNAKNAVLEWMKNWRDDPDFQALENNQVIAGQAVDVWDRWFDPGPIPKTALPIVTVYPNCLLRESRRGVRAELRVRQASIRMSLYANCVSHRAGHLEDSVRMYPQARVRIRAECEVTARILGDAGGVFSRPWLGPAGNYTPTITNPNTGPYPAVLPEFEHILYRDSSGTIFEPPLVVEWWGMLGSFSNPPTTNRWRADARFAGIAGMDISCGNLVAALDGQFNGEGPLSIPAWPYMGEWASKQVPPGNPNQIYEGAISLAIGV